MTQDGDPSDGFVDGDGPDENVVSVVSVDRRDDVGLICGKVDAAPSYWVILDAPRGNTAISSDLGMNRLRRHVEESGRAVAIATRSPGLSARARAAAIPVASRPEFVRWDAPGKMVVRVGGRSFAFPALGRYLQSIFLLVTLLAVVWLALAMGPSADVVIRPDAEVLTRTVQVRASAETEELDLATLETPLTDVSESTVITLSLEVTGTAPEPVEPAVVTVVVSNSTAEPVTIPAGEIVIAEPTTYEFATLEERTVPAGGTESMPARSVLTGSAQNVGAGTITRWGDDRPGLTVTNPEAATGGADRTVPAVSADDIVRLRELETSIRNSDAIRQLLSTERLHDAVFAGSAAVETEEVNPLPEVGTPIDFLLVDYRVTVTAKAIDAATLEAIARHVLQQDTGEGVFVPGSVTAREVPGSSLEADGVMSASFELSGLFANDIELSAIEDAVKGKSPESARSIVQERYGIEDVEVDLTPGWAPWIPRFGFRIDVQLQGQDEAGPAEGEEGADEGDDESTSDNPG